MTNPADKKALRKYFSELREKIKDSGKDKSIAGRILSFGQVVDADCVLIYASFGSEADTWRIAHELIKQNITVAYPKCGNSGIMTFHTVKSADELHEGRYGIPEPSGNEPVPEISERTVCIVPGLAFTENGGRLGYGGGYYDRFLKKYPDMYTIAPAYEKLVVSHLPVAEHDVKIKAIATEERLVLCNE
ncbi:MAG: 5-formyltetrahydrofolate cyclo-ligase [Ruminococcus sp.]|nr:5-formyltetrahydrofolate cyclo-ligase [Ruminococcus sp.]MDE7226491.1 5-formyltetrahydrofolate cyclo-ligase [Ruminococcus sp.]